MKKQLFNGPELEHLPIPCQLYKQVNDNNNNNNNNEHIDLGTERSISSAYHQNSKMKLLGGFDKSISRRIIIYDDKIL